MLLINVDEEYLSFKVALIDISPKIAWSSEYVFICVKEDSTTQTIENS